MIKNFNEWLTLKEDMNPNMMAPDGHTPMTTDRFNGGQQPLATSMGNSQEEQEESKLTGRIYTHLNLLTADLEKLTTIPKNKAVEIFDTVVDHLLKFPNINMSFLKRRLQNQNNQEPTNPVMNRMNQQPPMPQGNPNPNMQGQFN